MGQRHIGPLHTHTEGERQEKSICQKEDQFEMKRITDEMPVVGLSPSLWIPSHRWLIKNMTQVIVLPSSSSCRKKRTAGCVCVCVYVYVCVCLALVWWGLWESVNDKWITTLRQVCNDQNIVSFSLLPLKQASKVDWSLAAFHTYL